MIRRVSKGRPHEGIDLPGITSHIGNIIWLTTLLSSQQAARVRDAAEDAALHAMLAEPAPAARTLHDHLLNYRLLKAFSTFRAEVEKICQKAGRVNR